MRSAQVILVMAFVLPVAAKYANAQDDRRSLALQVVPLKPGESKFIEIALPIEEFRPAGRSGRSDLAVDRFPDAGKGGEFEPLKLGKAVGSEHFKAGLYRVADGVNVNWSNDKPGVVFSASANAKPGQNTIRVRYQNFGGNEHAIGFRIVISAEAALEAAKDKESPVVAINIDTGNFWSFRCAPNGAGGIGYGAGDSAGFKVGTFDFNDLVRKLREASASAPLKPYCFVVIFRYKDGHNESAYTKDEKLVLGLFDRAFNKEFADGHTEGFEEVWKAHPPAIKRDP